MPDGVHEDEERPGAVACLGHGHLGRPLRRRLRRGEESAAPRLRAQLPEREEGERKIIICPQKDLYWE